MSVQKIEKAEFRLKAFFSNLHRVAISGFFFLLPVFVVFIVVAKAWTSLTSIGAKIAGMFGVKSIAGVSGHTLFASLLLIGLCLVCGWLVRFSVVAAFSKAVESSLSRYIPGYDTYKALAEEKLQHKVRILPYSSALIKHQDFWRPAYIIEGDQDGNHVVFLPDIPDTDKGHVLLAKKDQIVVLSSVTANELEASLKKMGKGLLTEYRIQRDLLQV
jgi:uncharacterized membrane protein